MGALYPAIWRWHFYAGVLVIPFVVLLSLSGAVYLFKPQVERWEERAFHAQPVSAPVAPNQQLDVALQRYPGAVFLDYRLPEQAGDAALIRLSLANGGPVREVFVSPRGDVLGAIDPDRRIMAITKRVHSQLLVGGEVGNRLVELAACWAIVLILSGLYLWWPRGRGGAGVVWPRLTRGGRVFWRDLHAVTGFWVSSLALVMLVSGLPWTSVWGTAFGAVRAELGWVNGPAQWDIDGAKPSSAPATGQGHGHGHGHGSGPMSTPDAPFNPQVFDQMVQDARAQALAFPAIVTPPGAPGRFGAPGQMLWTIRSDAQNQPLRTTIRYDLTGHTVLSRESFADGHPIDRAVGYGIAWHEGQLFGLLNQIVGLLTALALVMVAISGAIMWLRRRPTGSLGAPPARSVGNRPLLAVLVACLAVLLPLFAFSLVAIILLEIFVLRRFSSLSRWLGLRSA
ncbi:MAG TPA: PepSY domain-containing protein [Croceibacterium sp.]|nr:PepSY domain-containing protein [Croceibacterium sp.]